MLCLVYCCPPALSEPETGIGKGIQFFRNAGIMDLENTGGTGVILAPEPVRLYFSSTHGEARRMPRILPSMEKDQPLPDWKFHNSEKLPWHWISAGWMKNSWHLPSGRVERKVIIF